jgi:hypothetical protein
MHPGFSKERINHKNVDRKRDDGGKQRADGPIYGDKKIVDRNVGYRTNNRIKKGVPEQAFIYNVQALAGSDVRKQQPDGEKG